MSDKIKILVVDDEEPILKFLDYVLTNAGYDTYLAANGEESEQLMAAHEFRIIVTDIHMPKRGGLDVIFDTHAATNPPDVIVISGGGKDLSYYFEEAKLLGATLTIKKPFDSAAILGAIEKCLSGN